MLLNDSLADQCTKASEDKAEDKQHTYRLVIDRKEQVVAVFGRITAINKILSVGVCSNDNREVVCADPEAKYTIAEHGLLEALVCAGLRDKVCNNTCDYDQGRAEEAHARYEHDDRDKDRHYGYHAELIDLRIEEHHRDGSYERDHNYIRCHDERMDESQHSAREFHNEDYRREYSDRDEVLSFQFV